MPEAHHKQTTRWFFHLWEYARNANRADQIGFSEHIIRVLVVGLAIAYTYILWS